MLKWRKPNWLLLTGKKPELFNEAEAPEGLYTILFISGKHSSALVSDKRIKGVSITEVKKPVQVLPWKPENI